MVRSRRAGSTSASNRRSKRLHAGRTSAVIAVTLPYFPYDGAAHRTRTRVNSVRYANPKRVASLGSFGQDTITEGVLIIFYAAAVVFQFAAGSSSDRAWVRFSKPQYRARTLSDGRWTADGQASHSLHFRQGRTRPRPSRGPFGEALVGAIDWFCEVGYLDGTRRH